MAPTTIVCFLAALAVPRAGAMQQHLHRHEQSIQAGDNNTFGLSWCPCVGIAGFGANVTVTIDDTKYPYLYTTDLGSSCQAWDAGKYPGSCDGGWANSEDWCSQKWCYVDPDNCKISSGPYESYYLPDATYHGKSLYYSYVTCNGTNTYN